MSKTTTVLLESWGCGGVERRPAGSPEVVDFCRLAAFFDFFSADVADAEADTEEVEDVLLAFFSRFVPTDSPATLAATSLAATSFAIS